MNYILLRPDVPSMLSLRVLSAILSTDSGEMRTGKREPAALDIFRHHCIPGPVLARAERVYCVRAQPRTRMCAAHVCGGESSSNKAALSSFICFCLPQNIAALIKLL